MNEYMNKQSEMGTYGGANVLYLWQTMEEFEFNMVDTGLNPKKEV